MPISYRMAPPRGSNWPKPVAVATTQHRFFRGAAELQARSPVAKSVHLCADWTQAVGQVPIVRLNNVAAIFKSRACYLKLESCNPGGSIKEKNAVWMVNQAERTGALRPGGTIVESSSGNFGLALAMIGALRGYADLAAGVFAAADVGGRRRRERA